MLACVPTARVNVAFGGGLAGGRYAGMDKLRGHGQHYCASPYSPPIGYIEIGVVGDRLIRESGCAIEAIRRCRTPPRAPSPPGSLKLVGVLCGECPSAFQDVAQRTPTATSPRGFPGAANCATISSMDWHPTPKDDAWRQAHLAMLERLGKDAWRRCDECAHTVMVSPREFADRHGLDMLTPLLTISRRMRCTRGKAGVGRRRMTHGGLAISAATCRSPSSGVHVSGRCGHRTPRGPARCVWLRGRASGRPCYGLPPRDHASTLNHAPSSAAFLPATLRVVAPTLVPFINV
jgi:hypothetical protein